MTYDFKCKKCGWKVYFEVRKECKETGLCGVCLRESVPKHIPPTQQVKYYFKLKDKN